MLSKEERARQFLPFDTLKGFNEALREKEKESEEKKELSEEEINKISEKLKTLEKGNKIRITHYLNKKYVTEIVVVKEINKLKQIIINENEKNIKFVDILKIEEKNLK